MTYDGWMTAGDYAFYVFSALALLFVMLYAIFSPWWLSETGRNIMAVMASLAIIGAYATTIRLMEHKPPLYAETRFALFALLAASVGKRIILFVRAQLLARRDKRRRRK